MGGETEAQRVISPKAIQVVMMELGSNPDRWGQSPCAFIILLPALMNVCMCLVSQLCLTLCDPWDS